MGLDPFEFIPPCSQLILPYGILRNFKCEIILRHVVKDSFFQNRRFFRLGDDGSQSGTTLEGIRTDSVYRGWNNKLFKASTIPECRLNHLYSIR